MHFGSKVGWVEKMVGAVANSTPTVVFHAPHLPDILPSIALVASENTMLGGKGYISRIGSCDSSPDDMHYKSRQPTIVMSG